MVMNINSLCTKGETKVFETTSRLHQLHNHVIYSWLQFMLLRASCLKLEINEFGCYEAKIEESEKGRQPPGVKPRTPLA